MSMADYLAFAVTVPGWRDGAEAAAVYEASHACPDNAVIVEVGVFLGRSTVLLAGARKERGSGKVHCVDPFDCSGDAFSVPFYREILASSGGGALRDHFDRYIAAAGLSDWVEVHQARAAEAAAGWDRPVDLLLLDGDQSPAGAREAFDSWYPHVRPGGVVILGNSIRRAYAETHDGNWLLASTEFASPRFRDVRQLGMATAATKT
jgi:predicted O-methyltransferase YrrM